MPELPEVETIKLGLQTYIVGHTIENVQVGLPKMVQGDIKQVIGAAIIGVERYGKGLVIVLSNGFVMAIHVKMTGQLIYAMTKSTLVFHPSPKVGGKLPNKFTHVIFKLSEGATLYYNDVRQFGWIKIVKSSEVKSLKFFKELGPEPLKDLNLAKFRQIVKAGRSPIKPLLMDQKKIGGIGNIYANDALWQAKINPLRKANSLSEEEIILLFYSIEFVLQKSLSFGGASEMNFVNALGEEGRYQNHFLVYGQQGKLCKRCGTKVIKVVLAGRGTFYCPKCQK